MAVLFLCCPPQCVAGVTEEEVTWNLIQYLLYPSNNQRKRPVALTGSPATSPDIGAKNPALDRIFSTPLITTHTRRACQDCLLPILPPPPTPPLSTAHSWQGSLCAARPLFLELTSAPHTTSRGTRYARAQKFGSTGQHVTTAWVAKWSNNLRVVEKRTLMLPAD